MNRRSSSSESTAAGSLSLTRHTTIEDIEEYIMGRLSEDATATLEEHILICETCRDRLIETEETIRLIRKALSMNATETKKPDESSD